MELGAARPGFRDRVGLADGDEDRIREQRLTELLTLNAEIARERASFRSDLERRQAFLMTRPIDSRKAYAYFGLMIGSMPPFALVLKLIVETMPPGRFPFLFVTLLALAGIATGAAGERDTGGTS